MEKSKKIKSLISTSCVTAGVAAVLYYLCLPALNLGSPGFWWFIFFVALTFAAVEFIKVGIAASWRWGDEDKEEFHGKVCVGAWIATAGLLAIIIILAFISSDFFHSSAAYAVADVEKAETSISETFPDLANTDAQSDLPLVDMDTAITLGDKKIAGLDNASWYDVDDEYNLIRYQGQYYRLSTIDYADVWKYWKGSSSGIPGYVLVSCTPENGVVTQAATLVELDTPIKYSPGAFWSDDLRRHLRSQYATYIFDSSFLEIDEEGTPYWVTGVKRPTRGTWGVMTIESFILTNAQSGESEEYSIDNAPEWIDHVFSLGYLMQIAKWHYSYEKGWWNSWIGQTGVWRTSYSYRDEKKNNEDGEFANFYGYSSTVLDDQIVFYTGLTAANKAESNLGWLTIDISSGKMTEHAIVGAEESSAQAAVEQLVAAQKISSYIPPAGQHRRRSILRDVSQRQCWLSTRVRDL